MTRELHAADAPQILEMMKAGAPGLKAWSLAAIGSEINDTFSFVTRDSSGVVEAFIFLRDAVDAFEISYLATNLQARKKGLMRGLLARATGFAQAKGRPVWLEVHEQNEPARKLYEAAGFVVTGRRPKYYSDGGSAILYNHG